MSLFAIPYRWTWKTVFKNIGWMFYSIRRGVRNIIRWTPVIWHDEDFDWDSLAKIMEWKLRKMSIGFNERGHLIDSKRQARKMLICAEILKRLREDNWDDLLKICSFRNCIHRHEIRTKEWEEMLGRIIGKHLRCWWD